MKFLSFIFPHEDCLFCCFPHGIHKDNEKLSLLSRRYWNIIALKRHLFKGQNMDLPFILMRVKVQSLFVHPKASQSCHNVQVFGEGSLTQCCLFDGDSDVAQHWKVSRTSLVPMKVPHLLHFDLCLLSTFHRDSAARTVLNTLLITLNLRYSKHKTSAPTVSRTFRLMLWITSYLPCEHVHV